MSMIRNRPSPLGRMPDYLSLIVFFALLLSACQPAPAPAQPTPTQVAAPTTVPQTPTLLPSPTPDYSPQLQGQLWVLVPSVDPANPGVVEAGITITAAFASDGTVGGSGGCNSYSGGYTLSGDQISVGPLVSTMMFCETGSDQEAAYLAALQQARRLAFTGEGRLQIFYDPGDGSEGVLVYVPEEKPLVGANWMLVSLGSPDQPTQITPGASVTARFSEDGSLTGNAGCNSYAASYTVQDGSLAITQPASTRMFCSLGMEQEAAYLGAISQAESYVITGSRLEITYDGGAGKLTYTSIALPLEYTLWTLAAFNGEPAAENVPLTVQFIPGEVANTGTVGGLVVCNNFNAGYTLDGESIAIRQSITTRMACPPDTAETERAYMAALEGMQSYQILADQMTITASGGTLAFVANRTPLEGTNWRLTALGDRANPTAPVEGSDFTAFFTRQPGAPSGLLQGRSGCNEYNTTYVASLTEIHINMPATTKMACPSPLAEQEAEYLQALTNASQYTIIGDVLKIPYGEEQMLSFVAVPVQAVPAIDLRPLQGTSWFLAAINGQPLVGGTQITAQFFVNPDSVSGSISGSAGCNSYSISINAGFVVGTAATKQSTCASPDGVMEQEGLYIGMLPQATTYALSGGQLILLTRGGPLVYTSTPPENTPPGTPRSLLINRQWYLHAIGDLNAISGSVPTAYFDSFGRVSGYTGCNNYTGIFIATNNRITIDELNSTNAACPEPLYTQELTFWAYLDRVVRFEVGDTGLRMYNRTDEVMFFQNTPPKPTEPGEPPVVEPPVDPVPPQAIIDAPRQAETGQEVTFDGSESQSGVGIVAYQWDFGDGDQATGAIVTHAYPDAGDFQVVLTVVDANNETSYSTWVISILAQEPSAPPPMPVAVIIAPPTGDTATPVIFDGSDSLSDASITSYQWDMGDDTSLEGEIVEYTFPVAGKFTVALTVTDAFGQGDTTTWNITVYEALPAAPDG